MKRMYLFASLVVLLLLGLYNNVEGQMTQYGKVVEMKTNGKALARVHVSVQSDAPPTSSDARGVFRLSFQHHQTGDTVHVQVGKDGYELVNIHVSRWTLTDRDTLRIVMAPIGVVREARMRYYGLVEAACIGRYESTMNLLNEHYAQNKISMSEFQFWKLMAENELNDTYGNMEYYADVFARIDEYDMDEMQAAINNRLESDDILGAMALASEKPLKPVMQAYLDFSNTFPLENLGEMELMAEMDSLPVTDTLYEYIMVLQTYVNLFEKDSVASCAKYAKSCAYLGVLYRQKGWDEASRKYFMKALRMYELLNMVEGIEVMDKIDRIKELLESK
ncbi:MAG: hypothetical protein K6A94_13225 [Bacteroidales bacterium]|nr:hypothetical protein [Bacteroidales bacterium]